MRSCNVLSRLVASGGRGLEWTSRESSMLHCTSRPTARNTKHLGFAVVSWDGQTTCLAAAAAATAASCHEDSEAPVCV